MTKIKKFKTADLCDDYSDNLVILSQQFKSYGKKESFCGQISTVKCFNDNSKVREAVTSAGDGKVLVVDGNASTDCALLGDMLAEAAVKNNWAGIDGSGNGMAAKFSHRPWKIFERGRPRFEPNARCRDDSRSGRSFRARSDPHPECL